MRKLNINKAGQPQQTAADAAKSKKIYTKTKTDITPKPAPVDKKPDTRTNADRLAYAKAQRAKAVKVVESSAGNSRLQDANMVKLRKADNALLKMQEEAEKSGFNNSDYKKIKKGMQR